MKTKIFFIMLCGVAAVAVSIFVFAMRQTHERIPTTAARDLELFQNRTIIAEVLNNDQVRASSTKSALIQETKKKVSLPIVVGTTEQGLCAGSSTADFLCYDNFFRELV